VQIDRSLGDIGAGGDVVDGGGRDALGEKQPFRGVHDLFAPHLRRFGSRTDFLHSSRSTLRRAGNSFIHNSAIATVPTPPRAAAGIAPSSAAVIPLSN